MAKVRRPCQAGTFYEANPEYLRRQIESCFCHRLGPGKPPIVQETGLRQIAGLICPHAGYMASGPVAAHAYYDLAQDGKPDVVVILGPNHTGYGSAIATVDKGSWHMPFGDVQIDGSIAEAIVHESGIVDIDEMAHSREHSIEVQLPFLQYLYGSELKMVPICFLMQDLTSARDVGTTLGKVLAGKNAVIIASSDFTHYEPQEQAKRKDGMAINAILALDESEFFSTIETQRITACGYGPIAALIAAVKVLHAEKAKLLCYETSGDVIGDNLSVVGYAAMRFSK